MTDVVTRIGSAKNEEILTKVIPNLVVAKGAV